MKTDFRTLTLLHSFFVGLGQRSTVHGLPGMVLLLVLTVFLSACESSDSTNGSTASTPKEIPKNIMINPGTRVIELAWSGVAGASGYNVYWSNQSEVSPSRGAMIATTEPHLVHRGLANGQPYYYVITAQTDRGESPPSAPTSATPQAAVPAQPSQLSARGGDERVTLQWEPIPGATHYTLYWNPRGSVSDTDARIDRVVSPFVHSNLDNEQTYYYVLVAENAAGSSSASIEVSAQARQPAPSAPVIEQIINAPGQATLHWGNFNNASQYTLYWNTDGNVSREDTAITQVISPYTVASLNDDVTYYYRLQAHNASGDSPLSNEAQVSLPDSNLITAPGVVPDVPAGVNVSLGNGQLSLDWPAVDGALGYNVYWRRLIGDEIVPGAAGVEKLAHLQPPYVHIGLNNGTTYRYRLSAFNHQGESVLSTEVSGSPQVIIPGVPAGVRAIGGDERIAVRWNPVQEAMGYTLYLDNQQGDARVIPNVSSPYEVSGLNNNTAYDVQVSAYNSRTESQRSAVITSTPREPIPNPPQQLSAQPSNGRVLLQWDSALPQDPDDSAQEIRGYRVYYDTRRGTNPSRATLLSESNIESNNEPAIEQTTGGRWQLNHTGLQNGQRYYYTVTAVSDSGASDTSVEVWARPEVPLPNGPSQVWAEAGNNQVIIHFTEVDSDASPTYNLYWSKQQAGGVSDTTVITNIQPGYLFSEGAETNGSTYYFQISAFNVGGESTLSPEVSASPRIPPPERAPQNLQSSAQSGQVILNWTPVNDASRYVIYWSTDPEIDPNTSARLSGDEVLPGYRQTGLVNGQTYYYQIAAINAGGESALSQTLIATPQVTPPATPSPPDLSAGDARVNIDFQAINEATSYTLFWHTNPEADLAQWSQQPGIQPGHRLDNLTNGQTYYFQLVANNAGGQSAPSDTRSAVPLAPIPATPRGVSAVAGDGQVSLNWQAQADVSYTLYWSDNASVAPTLSENFIENVRPSYTHAGLNNGTVYRYQLMARNSSGNSPATAIISATPNTQDTNPTNQAPQISEGATVSVTMDEDTAPTPFSLNLTASDDDGDPLSWSLSQAPTQGTASVSVNTTNTNAASINYNPNENYNGTDNFTIEVSDDQGGTDEISVEVVITPQNDAPVISAQTPTTIIARKETALTLTLNHLVVSDPDNTYPEDFSLTVLEGSGYTLSGNTLTPNVNVTGNLSVSVSVNDGEASSGVFNVSIYVDGLPTIFFSPRSTVTVVENSTEVMTVMAFGFNLGPFTYALSGGADQEWFVMANTSSRGQLSFLVAPDFDAPTDANGDNVYQVEVSASDGSNTATRKISVRVIPLILLTGLFADTGLQDCVDATGLTYAHEITSLACVGRGISDLSGIESLANLSQLVVTSNVLEDLNSLAGADLRSLTFLNLSSNQLTDISGLANAGLSNLTRLFLSNNKLANLNGLVGANFASLTELSLYNNQLTGVSGLANAGIDNLQKLSLRANQLANLSSLAGMDFSNLTELRLENNNLTDISGLASVTLGNLTALNLGFNQLENLNDLIGVDFSSLISLSLRNNNLTDISGLASLANAKLGNIFNLTFWNNRLENLNGLAEANASSLYSLDLRNNQLTDISELASMGLGNLTSLRLSTNQLGDLSGLANAGLSSLRNLYLSENRLMDVGGLASAELGNLTFLDLSINQLDDLDGLTGAGLNSLAALHLNGNRLIDVGGLANAGLSSNLTFLSLHSNLLENLNGLVGVNLNSLTELNLNANLLTDISELSNIELGGLRQFLLNNNAIINVSAIAGITSLSRVELSNNAIGGLGVGGVDSLAVLTNARSIGLTGNPAMSCTELQSLINAFESIIIVRPYTAIDGVDCTLYGTKP